MVRGRRQTSERRERILVQVQEVLRYVDVVVHCGILFLVQGLLYLVGVVANVQALQKRVPHQFVLLELVDEFVQLKQKRAGVSSRNGGLHQIGGGKTSSKSISSFVKSKSSKSNCRTSSEEGPSFKINDAEKDSSTLSTHPFPALALFPSVLGVGWGDGGVPLLDSSSPLEMRWRMNWTGENRSHSFPFSADLSKEELSPPPSQNGWFNPSEKQPSIPMRRWIPPSSRKSLFPTKPSPR